MSLIVKYTKAQYEAKITELEGYYNQLASHLANMNNLKSQMFDFWGDENGQRAGKLLSDEIYKVQDTMDKTQETLTFYRSAIEKMEGVNLNAGDLIETAIGLLGGL